MTVAQRWFLLVVAAVALAFVFLPFTKLPYESLYNLYGISVVEINILRGVALVAAFVAIYKVLGRLGGGGNGM